MRKIEQWILNMNFRKTAKKLLITALVILLGCVLADGWIFRDRLKFAWTYQSVCERVRDGKSMDLNADADALAATGAEIVDVLVVDENGSIVHSAKNSAFNAGSFFLQRMEGEEKNYINPVRTDTAFVYVGKDEFMLKSILSTDFKGFEEAYDEDHFFEGDGRQVILLNCIRAGHGSTRLYVLAEPVQVLYGALALKCTAALVVLIVAVYWVLTALWVYKNATEYGMSSVLFGLITLFTNLIGVLVYLLCRRSRIRCPECGVIQDRNHTYCIKCGTALAKTCRHCGTRIGEDDVYCSHCGKRISE